MGREGGQGLGGVGRVWKGVVDCVLSMGIGMRVCCAPLRAILHAFLPCLE